MSNFEMPDGPADNPNTKIPKIVRFLALHCGIGVAAGIIFVSAIYQMNVTGIRDLLMASSEPYVPLFILYVSSALTFGSLSMGMAVMGLEWKPPPDDDGDPK